MTAPKTPNARPSSSPDPRSSFAAPQRTTPPETVDPRWLLWAALAVVLLAAVCAYITLCTLFWKTQWQLVLHPSRTLQHTPADAHLPFQEVHFSPGPDGQPQLVGWWIPADGLDDRANPTEPTALLLHGGEGSMADSLPLAEALHTVHLNVLLFDYRGFGPSTGAHPAQFTMQQDAEAALDFLQTSRHLAPSTLIPVGEGLGASLAVRLAAEHHDLPAVILRSPRGDFEEEAQAASRSRLVPFKLLFHENFPLADPLHQLATPKLILSENHGQPSVIAQRAADPKMTVEGLSSDPAALTTSLQRFLDTYVQRPPQELQTAPTP